MKHHIEQDWSGLEPNQLVTVKEHGRPAFPATIDTKTPDSSVVWILPLGDHRRAIHSVDGAVVNSQPASAQP